MTGVPSNCELCSAAIPAGRLRCPECGKVYGEANRCAACHAIAAVREVEPDRYVCAACSAPRSRGPATPVDSDFAMELSRKATRDRVLSYVFFPVGGGMTAIGAALLGIGQVVPEGGLQAVFNVIGGLLVGLGAVGLYLASRARRSAKRLSARATDAQLVLSLGRAGTGLTAADAARAARLSEDAADERLTALAKQGQVELDVDDAGTIRYRVADPDAELDAQALVEAEATSHRSTR